MSYSVVVLKVAADEGSQRVRECGHKHSTPMIEGPKGMN